jgi:murein DD-endopeptidase MepM/ murein hydrolase activator NlpD
MKTTVTDILKNHKQEFHPVVPFSPRKDKLVSLDLSVNNDALTEEIYTSTNEFGKWVDKQINQSSALYALGGYNEHRKIYNRSRVFDSAIDNEEPRRLHLGTDIWGKCNTPVFAPMNGVVHSFAFNNNFGDYGATIILSHYLDGNSFFTLYGHLSLNSIKNLQEGYLIKKGEVFAEFGMQFENGNWPPHLHFQIITDLEGWKGDYPGVCKFSERSTYLSNCPDPDLILQMNQYLK